MDHDGLVLISFNQLPSVGQFTFAEVPPGDEDFYRDPLTGAFYVHSADEHYAARLVQGAWEEMDEDLFLAIRNYRP